jgi:hypothetical protein
MSVTSETIAVSIEDILTALKSFETPELFKLLKSALTEAEKKSKITTKATKVTTKKQGSMPKGTVPPQLKKPRAWVEFTLKHALENGWESFTITQKKKDGEIEEIEMPASIYHEGAHIYEDSISEKTPNGKQIIHKEAMSLSKQRKEAGHPTYAEFEAEYTDDTPASDDTTSETSSTTSSKKSIVKKTAAEKQAEMEAKKAEKEQAKAEEKERKKAEKEQAKAEEKERKKAEKEAEKEAKKAEKDAEKEAKKAEKKPVAKAVVPAKAPSTPVKVVKTEEQSSPAGAAGLGPIKAAKPTPKKEEVIPDDGMVHPWTFEGKKYLRNADGETWLAAVGGGIGKWVGVYSSKTNKIDTSATEPEFDDEE